MCGSTEILILADGCILVHNLTPEAAAMLRELNPQDSVIAPRKDASDRFLQAPSSSRQRGIPSSLINRLPTPPG